MANISNDPVFNITVDQNSYLYPHIKSAISTKFPNSQIISVLPSDQDKEPKPSTENQLTVHYGEYEDLDFDRLSTDPNYFGCSYIYRKGIIRKHFLSHTIAMYTAKHPDSILVQAAPETFQLQVDYAEFLDDSLDESFELRRELEINEENEVRKSYILKPGMSDKGQGIRIFQTIAGLQRIFDEFEEDETETDDDEDEDEDKNNDVADNMKNLSISNDSGYDNNVITSQLRHFIVQEYYDSPLLLPAYSNRKFHIRVYVVCIGALKVYVYKNMLALFASTPYVKPTASKSPKETTEDNNDNDDDDDESDKDYQEGEYIPLDGHLTNTCLQPSSSDSTEPENDDFVHLFWDLEDLSDSNKTHIYNEICETTGDLFRAAVGAGSINFAPLDNAFEIYGVDFLVNAPTDNDNLPHVKLLEVNAYPDFKQTGDKLTRIIGTLFSEVFETAVKPYISKSEPKPTDNLTLVLDEKLSNW